MQNADIQNENFIELNVHVVPIYTLLGKKFLYRLGDMAYGEWLIYRENMPVYFLNTFEECYLLNDLKTGNFENYIENKLKKLNNGTTLFPQIIGIKSFKTFRKIVKIERMPCSFLDTGA